MDRPLAGPIQEQLSMETKNCPAEPRAFSTDPIAAVRLWPVLLLIFAAVMVVTILLPASPSQDLKEEAYAVAAFAAIVVWWQDAVAGATRRAGFQPSTPSAGAVLLLSSKVAVSAMLAKLIWLLLQHALGLPHLGVVTAPTLVASEPTALSLTSTVLVVALLAPVAEEMLFRGALFRKWRLRLGPGKAAVLTSVLFGLVHASAPTAALSALSMVVLYTTTRTIWAPIAAHAMNNLFAVLLGHAGRLLPLAVLEWAADWRLQLAFVLPGLLGTSWLVRFLRRGWHTLGDPVHGCPVDARETPPVIRQRPAQT
jgi:membrane protease YdiL (CAAX protease family)